MNKDDKFHTVVMKKDVTVDQVCGLICTGMEGGIGYWCAIDGYIDPPDPPEKSIWFGDSAPYRHNEWPLIEGAAVLLEITDEEKTVKFDKPAVLRGLELMPRVAPRHWQDFCEDNTDANTGDVFIQLCVLGEIVYG